MVTDSPSVAVVVLDTLRKDTFDRYFSWVDGVRYDAAYSTANWTVPAHASLLTGKYASELGVHGKSRSLDCPETTVVEAFRDAGYTTRLWSSNVQITAWDGWDRGFDHVREPMGLAPLSDRAGDWEAFGATTDLEGPSDYWKALAFAVRCPEPTVPTLREGYRRKFGGPDASGAPMAKERIEHTDFDDREFLLVNLMEPHTPHRPPDPYRTYDERVNFRIGDAFADAVPHPARNRRAYDDSAAYLASVYRDVYARLKESFDVVVTLSDHGELLGEHGMWNHGYGVYPELARVPLVVWTRDLADAERRADVVSLLDVPRTVAEVAGVEFPRRGTHLLDDRTSADRLVEYHGFLPMHRDQFERYGIEAVYDEYDAPLNGIVTASGEYYYETHDDGLRSAGGDGVAPDVRERLDDLVGDLSRRATSTDDGDVPDGVRDRLEDLGYA